MIGYQKADAEPFNRVLLGPYKTKYSHNGQPVIIDVIKIILVFGLAWTLEGCLGEAPSKGVYDGTTANTLAIENLINPETYTIDLKLKSTTLLIDKAEYGETTPPMPFRAGRVIALYQTPNGYRISIRDASQERIIQKVIGEASEWTRITIAASADGVILYVNGGEAVRSSTPAPLSGNIRIGAGYKKRFWRGQYKYFDVYNNLKSLGEFAPDAARFDSDELIMALIPD